MINFFGKKIKNVHIKDRTYGGETKQFGLGNTNFNDIFIGLKEINYEENLILQLAREINGNEVTYINNSYKKIINLL
jgi:sugar phosphate isomerase/epimerase